MEPSLPRKLLAVLAHPDDETFGMGGTLALYSRQGVEVCLVCATRGEAGEVDPVYMDGFTSIAERRENELRCASGLLGISNVHFLDYRDSGMTGSKDNQHPGALINASSESVADRIAAIMQELQPLVVVTFDPAGGYRHPDHIAIHLATARAFEIYLNQKKMAGEPINQFPRFFFNTFPHKAMRLLVRLMPLIGKDPHHFGRNGDIDLAVIAADEFPTNAVIDYLSVAKIRDEASACHASQGGKEMKKSPLGWIRRIFGSHETYMQAYPPPRGSKKLHDLFEPLR